MHTYILVNHSGQGFVARQCPSSNAIRWTHHLGHARRFSSLARATAIAKAAGAMVMTLRELQQLAGAA